MPTTTTLNHPLEATMNATAWDILSAIERGFRACCDVRGKLAEWHFNDRLLALKEAGVLASVKWRDQDGLPDFPVTMAAGVEVEIECKNVLSGKPYANGDFKLELQKARNAIGGGPGRGYRHTEFGIVSACLFNQCGQWSFKFAATSRLPRQIDHPDYLVVMQRVAGPHWHDSLEQAIEDYVCDRLKSGAV